MKVVLIRHGKVDFNWNKWSTSEQFDMDCKMYDKASVIPFSIEVPQITYQKIYVSNLPRSKETAVQIFGEKHFITTSLINEVPLHSSIVVNIKLPLWFWNMSGRLQWMFNNPRQIEGKKATQKRAEQFVKMILENKENCFVITHGFFLHPLINNMRKNKFTIKHAKLSYDNGECIIAER